MPRPAHGATSRPGPVRPGSGYGRPLRNRPAGTSGAGEPRALDLAWWLERELELEWGLEAPPREADRRSELA
jgi:hypothetical protein